MYTYIFIIHGRFYKGDTGWHCQPVPLPLPTSLPPPPPPPPPPTQKLLFKVPFSLPVACGHEKCLENECSLLHIEARYVLCRLMY